MPRGLGTPGTQTTCCSYIGTFSEYVVTNERLANVYTVAWNPVIGPDRPSAKRPTQKQQKVLMAVLLMANSFPSVDQKSSKRTTSCSAYCSTRDVAWPMAVHGTVHTCSAKPIRYERRRRQRIRFSKKMYAKKNKNKQLNGESPEASPGSNARQQQRFVPVQPSNRCQSPTWFSFLCSFLKLQRFYFFLSLPFQLRF